MSANAKTKMKTLPPKPARPSVASVAADRSDTDPTVERRSPDASGPLPQFGLGDSDEVSDTDRTHKRVASEPAVADRTPHRRRSADASGPLPQFNLTSASSSDDAGDADRTLERPTRLAIPQLAVAPSPDRTEEIDAVDEVLLDEALTLDVSDLLEDGPMQPAPAAFVATVPHGLARRATSTTTAMPRGIGLPTASPRIEFVGEQAWRHAPVQPVPVASFAPTFAPERLDFAALTGETRFDDPRVVRRRRRGIALLAGVVAIAAAIGAAGIVRAMGRTAGEISTEAPARASTSTTNAATTTTLTATLPVATADEVAVATATTSRAVSKAPPIVASLPVKLATSPAAKAPPPVAKTPVLSANAAKKLGLAAPAGKPPASKAAPTTGTLRTSASAAGHRMFVDGALVGDAPRALSWSCGTHWVRIGSSGPVQQVTIPCGGEVTVSFR